MRGEVFTLAKYKLFARQLRNNGDNELADMSDKAVDQEYPGNIAHDGLMAIALVLLLFAPPIAAWLRNSKAPQSKLSPIEVPCFSSSPMD